MFASSQAIGRAFIGGNRSGKTEIGAVEASRYALGKHPFRRVPPTSQGWVISVDYNVQRDVIQRKLSRYIPRERIAHLSYRGHEVWDRMILTCPQCLKKPAPRRAGKSTEPEAWWCVACNHETSTIGFKSYDQGRAKFQGTDLDYWWADEEMPKDIFGECMIRLTDRAGHWWMTMTPVEGMGWTFDEIFNSSAPKSELEVFTASMYDNKHIPRSEVEKREKEITDQALKDIRIHGKYAILSGLIYKSWEPKRHEVEELPKEFLDENGKIQECFDIYAGIDTGRFFGASFWLIDFFGNAWGFGEVFTEDKSTRHNVRLIRDVCEDWGVDPDRVTYYLDPRSQIMADLADEGISCVKIVDEQYGGIQCVISYMSSHGEKGGHPQMFVVAPSMPRFLWERKRYQWEKATKAGSAAGQARSNAVKKDDHVLDSCRSVLMMKPPPSVYSVSEADKPFEQRIRERVQQRLIDRDEGREREEEEESGGGEAY